MSASHHRRLRVARKLWNHQGVMPPGSDGRVKGGVLGRCILCGRRCQLRLSHIVPRWACAWHRQAWKGKVKGMYFSLGVESEEQDSNKHYLMCDGCEQLASKDESYVRILVDGSPLEKRRKRIFELKSGFFLHIDPAAIGRFVAINALRCHYAPSAPFHDIWIPPHHRKLLRSKILNKMSPMDIPWVSAVRFVPPEATPTHDPRCDIFSQYEENILLGPIFAALIGGWEWYLFFEKNQIAKSFHLNRRFLVKIHSLPYNEYRLFTRMSEAFAPYIDKMNDGLQ